jgi:hypothetical protein
MHGRLFIDATHSRFPTSKKMMSDTNAVVALVTSPPCKLGRSLRTERTLGTEDMADKD